MKNIIVVAFFSLLFSFSACKKDPQTYCFECIEYEVLYEYDMLVDAEELNVNVYCGLQRNQVYMFEYNTLIYSNGYSSIYRMQSCQIKEDEGASQN